MNPRERVDWSEITDDKLAGWKLYYRMSERGEQAAGTIRRISIQEETDTIFINGTRTRANSRTTQLSYSWGYQWEQDGITWTITR